MYQRVFVIYMSSFHFVVAKAHIDHVSLRGFYIDSESVGIPLHMKEQKKEIFITTLL